MKLHHNFKFLQRFTHSTNQHTRPLQSKVSITAISSAANLKSNTLMFSSILFLVTDFGMGLTPDWSKYLNMTWAGDLLYLAAIDLTFGSSVRIGSSGLAHGLSGEPKGLYAVTTISLDLQYAISFFWFRYGWHSICKKQKLFSKLKC